MDLDLVLDALASNKNLDKIETLAFVMRQQAEYLDIKIYNYQQL